MLEICWMCSGRVHRTGWASSPQGARIISWKKPSHPEASDLFSAALRSPDPRVPGFPQFAAASAMHNVIFG